jgi:hypothetical protein
MDNGAIYLLELNKAVPDRLKVELNRIEQDIVAGDIQVVDIPTAVELRKFLKKNFPR